MKHLVYKTNIPIYFGRLVIVFTDNFNKANIDLKLNMEADLSGFGAFVIGNKTPKGITRYILCFDKRPSHKEIAHECVHAVNWLFKDRHVQLDLINDEPQAYLMGYFIGEVYKAMKKLKVKCYDTR